MEPQRRKKKKAFGLKGWVSCEVYSYLKSGGYVKNDRFLLTRYTFIYGEKKWFFRFMGQKMEAEKMTASTEWLMLDRSTPPHPWLT